MEAEFDNFEEIEAIVKDQLDFKTRYSDLEVIGQGGMGKVFCALDKKLAKRVAIKFLHNHADFKTILRFQQEARALSKVNHQYIVKVLDFRHSENGELFLVLEYVEGKSLESILNESGALSFSQAVRYTTQLCEALEHAHSQEIVHRDLKPSNILIDHENCVRILDFGMAKLVLNEDPFGTLTRPGQMLGTPLYMSPEQVRGEVADARSDVYSLGMVLYAMLAGKPPWDGEQVVVMFREKISSEPPPLGDHIGESEAARGLERIVAKAMRSDPDERIQTMGEFRSALSEVVVEPVAMKQPTAQPSATPYNKKLTRRLSILVACIVFVLASAGIYSYQFYRKINQPINANQADVAANFSFFSNGYNVVDRAPSNSSTTTSSTNEKTSVLQPKASNAPKGIPGFFKQTELKEEIDFWFARPFVNDQILANLDPEIRELSLSGNKRVTDEGLRAIPVRQLRKIDLTETKFDDKSLEIVAGMKNLIWVRLNRTSVTDGGVKKLAPLAKQLERLDLDQCKGLTNSGLRFVVNTFPKLTALHIGDTSVTSDGIRLLGAHPNLREIWLSSLHTTDDDVRTLRNLDLGLLDLSGCPQITDDIFTSLEKQPHLGYLEMFGCPKITAAKVADWKIRHPLAQVHWQDADEADMLTESGLLSAPEKVE